jgi:hypothetical protein
VIFGFANIILLFGYSQGSLAGPCGEGSPLPYLINSSDAVALIETSTQLTGTVTTPIGIIQLPGVDLSRRRTVRTGFRFLQFLKPSLLGGEDKKAAQTIFLLGAKPKKLAGVRTYLAFLRYVRPNVWLAEHCGYLEITPKKRIRYACEAINDLFGDKPYERERLCLLSYPPDADLEAVRKEIMKKLPRDRSFSGAGRITKSIPWRDGVLYQKIWVELDARTRREFFAEKQLRTNRATKLYIRSDAIEEATFVRKTRAERRIKFSGVWSLGSFVIEELR